MMKQFVILGTGALAQRLSKALSTNAQSIYAYLDEYKKGSLNKHTIYSAKEFFRHHNPNDYWFLVAISNAQYVANAHARLLANRVPQARIFEVSSNSFVSVLQTYLSRNSKSFHNALEQAAGNSNALEEHYSQLSMHGEKELSFRFFDNGVSFVKHFSKLPNAVAKVYETETLSDETMDTDFPNHFFCSKKTALSRGAKLIVTSQLGICSAPNYPKMTLLHTIYDSPVYHSSIVDILAQPTRHYLTVASKPSMRQLRKLCEKHRCYNVTLIPAGYPKLDLAVASYIENTSVDTFTILYAPSEYLVASEQREMASSIKESLMFIPSLLKEFPDSQIIVRPHPVDIKSFDKGNSPDKNHRHFAKLLDLIDSSPRITLDNRSQQESFSVANALITDVSSSAYSYAFTTLKPVFFYSKNDYSLLSLHPDITFLKHRQKIGAIVQNRQELVDAIGSYRSNSQVFWESIKTLRSDQIYNFGNALNYIYSSIEIVLSKRKQPDDWIDLSN